MAGPEVVEISAAGGRHWQAALPLRAESRELVVCTLLSQGCSLILFFGQDVRPNGAKVFTGQWV